MYKFIFIVFAFLIACSLPKKDTKVESKKKEVMEIHDIAMDKMGEMMSIKKKLKSHQTEDSLQQIKINSAIKDLEAADKLMWDWMHNYHHEIVDTSKTDEALKYLDNQYKSVKIVEEKINSSIKNGKELL